jgi:exo-1,4-beta-D-glucosaminidase
VAFFIRASVRRGKQGDEVLPVLWDDGYITLLPGEARELAATYAAKDLGGATPVVSVEGWNVAPVEAAGR